MIHRILTFLFAVSIQIQFAQSNWTNKNLFEQKNFIENKGQVAADKLPNDEVVLYTAFIDGVTYYFTKNGYTISHPEKKIKRKNIKREEDEKGEDAKEERERLTNFRIIENYHELKWEDANPNPEIIPEDPVTNYYSYPDLKNLDKKITIIAHAFKKITYKELYPHTDVVFEFPKDSTGIKYSIYLHPGADVGKIKMIFPHEKINLTGNMDLEIHSDLGKITDHHPTSYSEENRKPINSNFKLTKNQIGFELEHTPVDETIIIDPWTVTPLFDSTSNAAYDVDYDNAGNVYVYGGFELIPFVLLKYNAAGTLMWSFTPLFSLSGISYYGDFTIDKNSNSIYLADGYASTSAQIIKINPSAFVMSSFLDNSNTEVWRIVYSRCSNELITTGINFGDGISTLGASTLDTSLTTLTHTPYTGEMDAGILALDNYGNCYELNLHNELFKLPLPGLSPSIYNIATSHMFLELSSIQYYGAGSGIPNGYNGLATFGTNVYSFDGRALKKWDGPTGSYLAYKRIHHPIESDSSNMYWGGIAADDCGNLFVGDSNKVLQFDSTLTLITSYTMPGAITDISFSTTGQLYVCGIGFLSSLTPTGTVICTTSSDDLVITSSAVGATCTIPGSASVSVSGGTLPYSIIWNTLPVQYGDSAFNLTPGSYSFTVTDNSCLRNRHVDTVVVPALDGAFSSTPVITIGCPGEGGSIVITNAGGVDPYSYAWSPVAADTNALYELTQGSYAVTITDSAGCRNIFPALVVDSPSVIHYTFAGHIKCINDTVTLTIRPTGGVTPYTIDWTSPVALGTNHISGTHAGTFAGTITGANGCVQPFSYVLTEPSSAFTAFSTSSYDCTIPNYGSIAVTASGGDLPYTYYWSGSSATGSSRSPVASGIYTVTVSDSNDCVITLTDTVPVYGPLTITAGTTETCLGGTDGSITASVTGGAVGETYNYSWSGFSSDSTNVLSNIGVGTYTVTVTSGLCTGTASFSVSQLPVSTTTVPANICIGETYTLPSGSIVDSSGTYTDTIPASGGCDSIVATVLTVGIPLASAGPDVTIAYAGNTTLTPTGGTSYSWSPAATLSCTGCTNPVASPLQTTTYTMTATNERGCTATDEVTVFVDPPPCTGALVDLSTLIPNAFSPNNDALNDELCIPSNPCISGISLLIYDRWGEKVYEGHNLKDCWDGTYNGKKLESAVFAYYLTVTFIDGTTKNGKGNISLVK